MDQLQRLPVEVVHRQEWHDKFAQLARLAPEKAAYVGAPKIATCLRIGDVYFDLARGEYDSIYIGSVFKLGAYGSAAHIVDHCVNLPGIRKVRLTAFDLVARRVWVPLGFDTQRTLQFDWRQAPLLWRSAYGMPAVHMMELKL